MIHSFTAVMAVLSFTVLGMMVYIYIAAPEHYYNIKGEEFTVSPLFGVQLGSTYKKEAAAQASETAPVRQEVQLSLFGLIPVKTATVETIPKLCLPPAAHRLE